MKNNENAMVGFLSLTKWPQCSSLLFSLAVYNVASYFIKKVVLAVKH